MNTYPVAHLSIARWTADPLIAVGRDGGVALFDSIGKCMDRQQPEDYYFDTGQMARVVARDLSIVVRACRYL
jgi:hypothetical protein